MKLAAPFIIGTLVTAACITSNSANAGPGDSSFTPSSVIVPVTEISLRNGHSVGSVLYTCSGTLADCGVDMTDVNALAALSVGATINAGTYDRVVITTCRDEGSYEAKVTGTINIDGTSYYTMTPATPGANILSTDSTDLGPVSITYPDCVREYLLASSITIADGDDIVINLFVNFENIAWARTASLVANTTGCVTNAVDQAVCTAYPAIIASTGRATPFVQTYHVTVNDSGQVDGQLSLVLNSDGAPIGGFMRPYYDTTNSISNGFNTPLKTFSLNSDGTTYTLGNYGGTVDSYNRLITDFMLGRNPGDISVGTFDASSPDAAGLAYSAILQ